jgi:plasmid stabilization system protein ParE
MAARFLPAAESEFLREVDYYSKQREGLGVRFRLAVMATVEKAATYPARGAPSHHGTRSRMVDGFPFRLIYRESGTELVVVAVSHQRRRPGYWADRQAP